MHGVVWFLADKTRWDGDAVVLDQNESHHAIRVLRAEPPDVITIADGEGTVARCAISSVAGGTVTATVLERREVARPVPEICVYQGAAKGSKNDDVVERLAELGVSELRMFTSARSVVKWDEAKRRRLEGRWAELTRSAAKQSRNAYLMAAGFTDDWRSMLDELAREDSVVVLWEQASIPLRAALIDGARRLTLVVGPEGGFEQREVEELAEAGAQVASLGPTILRTENAAMVACSAAMYHYGTIG